MSLREVLIVAAPFGLGPASKALIIAEYLRGGHRLSFSAEEGPASFLRANAPPGAEVVVGRFRERFGARESLAPFDVIISVNQMPALRHVCALGLARRAIFVDSLAGWRAEAEPEGAPEGLLAHVVQDEIPDPASPRRPMPPGAVLCAPLVWPSTQASGAGVRRGVIVHAGGMGPSGNSRAIVAEIAARLIVPIVIHARRRREQVALLGKAEVFGGLSPLPGVTMLGSISPAQALAAISQAELLVTTPGIGAIYEAMSCRTPVLLLPPMNSTQARHARVLARQGIPTVISAQTLATLGERLATMPWHHQTAVLLASLAQHAGQLAVRARAALDRMLIDESDRIDALAKADALWGGLSRVSPRDIIRAAVDSSNPDESRT
jgi:hypothetical protein